jgi:hypothetical protein
MLWLNYLFINSERIKSWILDNTFIQKVKKLYTYLLLNKKMLKKLYYKCLNSMVFDGIFNDTQIA